MKIEEITKILIALLGSGDEEPIIDLADDIQIEIQNVSVGNWKLMIRVL